MKRLSRRLGSFLFACGIAGGTGLVPARDVAAQDTTRATGALTGTITDLGGTPVENADVVVVGTAMRTRTRPDGGFLLRDIPPGSREFVFRKPGYEPAMFTFEITGGTQVSVAVKLNRLTRTLDTVRVVAQLFNELSGFVTDTLDRPLADVDVQVVGSDMRMRTSAEGRYLFLDIPAGRYVVRMRKLGFRPVQRAVEMVTQIERIISVRMVPLAQELPAVMITEQSGLGGRSEVALRDMDVRRKMSGWQSDIITREDLALVGKASLLAAIREKGAGTVKNMGATACVLVDGVTPSAAANASGSAAQPLIRARGSTSMTGGRADTRGIPARRNTETSPLGYYFADQVEFMELYPEGSEMSMTACARFPSVPQCSCSGTNPPAVIVVWLRK